MNKAHMLLILIMASLLLACTQTVANEGENSFPYEDLSEEAYIQNAQDYWIELSNHLEASSQEGVNEALKDFDQEMENHTSDKFSAMEMIVHYHTYLAEQSSQDEESLSNMSKEERDVFQQKNRIRIQKEIPNALKVQKLAQEAQTKDSGWVGRMTYRDGKVLTVYQDGTLLVSG